MAVQRLGWLAGMASVVGGATAMADDQDVHRSGPERQSAPVVLGLMADAGVPDGANAALVLSPAPWLRLHAGGGSNTVSAGYRGGLTVMVPLAVSPSFSVEAGHFREGNANGLVRSFVGGDGTLKPLFERFGYTYVNTQLGLELGRGPVQFFIHGGLSHISATLHNADAALNQTRSDPSVTVVVRQDPVLRAWVPSVKLGLLVYLGGGR
jgi:hypothetical protein